MSDYVQLKNLQGQPLKPVTDLAAINMTTTNGIQVVQANGGTIGITSGYIDSAYYIDMVSEDVGPASTSSAYIEGGTVMLITGAYTVTSAVNSSTPSQQKIPSEAAVVSAINNAVTSGASYYAGTGIAIDAGHTISVSGVPTSAVAGLDTDLSVLSSRIDTIASLPAGSTSGDAELIDIRVGADGTTYPTAGDAVRGQVDDIYDLIDDYATDQNIVKNEKFDFTHGQVETTGAITATTRKAYVYYNDDTVRSISFDDTVYKMNIFAFNGEPSDETRVLYQAWTTVSPLAVPVIPTHTCVGVMITRLDNAAITLSDVKEKTTFVSVTSSPFALKDWVLAKDTEIAVASVTRFLGKKIPYPTGFESRLKPQIYKSAGGRYMVDVDTILSANRIVDGNTTPVWVATDGNDSNDGTENSPFATITHALGTSAKTIYVKAGTYIYGTHYVRYCNPAGRNLIGVGTVIFDSSTGDFPFQLNNSAYIENIIFKGGTYGFNCKLDATKTVTLYKCAIQNTTDRALAAQGGNYYLIECSTHDNDGDGFNYHSHSTGGTVCAVEVDCIAYNCGDGTFHSDNGSTTHDGNSIVRVNGAYWNCHGGVVGDIGVDANTLTYSCNFGVYAGASTNHTTGDEMYDASFWCSVYTRMWLFDCVAEGSRYDISCYTNSVVKSVGLVSPDMFSPTDYTDGTGTITRM